MSAPTRRRGRDHSKGPWLSRAASALARTGSRLRSSLARRGIDFAYVAAIGLAIAAAAGPLLLVVSDFTTLFEVRTVTAKIAAISGGKNHLFAMVVIGVAAALMAWGAIRGGSQPAMMALAALGVLAAVIALAFDLPDATGTSTLNRSYAYANADAFPRLGFYLETLGAALTIVAGGGALLLTGSGGGEPDRDPQARASAAAARAERRGQA